MTRPVQNDDRDVRDRPFDRVCDELQILFDGRVYMHVLRRLRTDGELIHIRVRRVQIIKAIALESANGIIFGRSSGGRLATLNKRQGSTHQPDDLR